MDGPAVLRPVIEAITEITNVGEQRALEKAGFTREGILPGATYRPGSGMTR